MNLFTLLKTIFSFLVDTLKAGEHRDELEDCCPLEPPIRGEK
jgi:hypothetical protein